MEHEQTPSTFGRNLGKRLIRFALSVLGLLVLRGIIGALPMLKSASAIGDSLLSPLVVAYAAVDTVIQVVVFAFGLTLGQDLQANIPKFSDLGKIISRATVVTVLIIAYKAYELPAACLFVDQTDLLSFGKNNTVPGGYGDLMRMWSQMVGQVSAVAIQNATGDALVGYQKLALAVFRQPPNIYAWVFLILIAIPTISLVPLVARNMDRFTELVSQAAATLEGAPRGPGSAATSNEVSPVERVSGSGNLLSTSDVVEKLIKLKSLLDAEAISTDDFGTQKRRILSQSIRDSDSVTEPEDLRKLKALLDLGALTQEEYETCKTRFLERI